MSTIIKDGANDTLFEVDGLQYRKGMYELYYSQDADAGNLIGIRNIHNQSPIQVPTKPKNYDVNGVITEDIEALATSLSVVLGFNPVGGGITEETDPIFNASVAKNLTQPMLDYLGIAGFQNTFVTTADYNLVVSKNVVMVTLKAGASVIHLPVIAGESGRIIFIINMSGVACTVESDVSDGNVIWDGGTLTNTLSLAIGGKTTLMNNTENYVVIT